jgi:WD40 repeat protein
VTFSPDGRWLIVVAVHWACLWELTAEGPSTAPVLLEGPVSGTAGAAVSKNSPWLATAGKDNSVLLWDLTRVGTSEPVVLPGHSSAATAVAMSPDGRWLASGSEDETVRLWKLSARDPAASPIVLHGHGEPVITAAFSPDGCWLATGTGSIKTSRTTTPRMTYALSEIERSPNAEIRLWDMRGDVPGANAVSLRGHTASITGLAFTPDSRWLLSASRDNTIRLWAVTLDGLMEVARRTVGRNFTSDEWKQYFGGQPYRKTFPDLPADSSSLDGGTPP